MPNITGGFLQISNGNITLAGTGRIQGVDTVTATTDAANKAYVDAHPGSGGTVTSVATGNGLTGGTITSTGTLTMASSYTGGFTFNTSVASPIHSGTVSTSGDGQNNYPFRLGSDYSAYMVAAASNTWGLFWAGNSGARYGTNGNGGPGNIWSNSTNPNEFCFVGGDSTRWSVQGSTGDTWQLGNIYLSGTFVRANNNLTLQVDGGGTPVNAITIDNVGSTTFSGYTYFPNYLFHAGDTNTRIQFTTGTITLRGDTSILLDGPVTANSTMTVASTLTANGQITANSTIYLKDRITLPASGLSSVSGRPGYAIYQEGGAWTNPYPDLCIAMHTGIKFGANASYNGMRFYDDYTMATQVMSINNTADGNGAGNVYINSICNAGGSMRSPIFYDSNNTAYYLNPAGESKIVKLWINNGGQGGVGWSTGFNQGSGSNYWNQIQDGGVARQRNFGTGGYDWFSSGAAQLMTLSNGGTLFASADMRSPIFYDSNDTAYYGNFASTSNFNTLTLAGSLTVQSGSGTINGKATQLFEHGYGSDSGTFYQTSGSFAGYSGWANYWIGNHGNGATYYNTVDIRPFWGPPKYSRLEGGTFRGPYNYVTNETDQTIGVYLQSTTSLRAPIFYDYNNTAFYLDPSTTGTSVNVAGDVVAYASSDIRFKNNITPITNALDKLSKIGGYTFEWNEISHKETGKKDIGVVAQEVEEILPEIVQTRSNGYKAVDYQKLTALLIESVKEQQVIINDLKSRIETLENN